MSKRKGLVGPFLTLIKRLIAMKVGGGIAVFQNNAKSVTDLFLEPLGIGVALVRNKAMVVQGKYSISATSSCSPMYLCKYPLSTLPSL